VPQQVHIRGQWLSKPAVAATIARMAVEAAPLKEQLEEIGAQLDWVRDYL
jgi:hypothetical protein